MKHSLCLLLLLGLFSFSLNAQEGDTSPLSDKAFSGLKFRNIGPAFTSGRIADIAVHPEDENYWYVAVGSGGVWKTTNAGVTWSSIFDQQASYSIGCVTIDQRNPHTIWVGTGENVGGRHVGFGDGVYKSTDDGRTWKNMGLKESEHISKILVHPDNSDVIWVAAQGPLWSKGGERGLYKSTDGGATWKKVLGDDEWVGVTDIVIDPRDPSRLYAATWQRHRNVAAYMGTGPGSGIHRSTDGGETWEKLTTGLPNEDMGKIGLALSPQQPDVLYAAIELKRATGGIYKSTDRGASWKKQSDAVSGATGPHYYQELYASPHQFDLIYLMDNRAQVSYDGGKTFDRLMTRASGIHSDHHALVFRADDPDYLLMGSDGGVYESFDHAKTWRFMDNMPITQYYKVAVDDAEPFYFVYGGTQDNGSHGGPSRTDTEHGIRNADWFKTLGADGHQSATEPGNPNITYAETQQGGLHRVDRITGEQVFIQPQPEAGEPYERYNWDAPILVSPHSPSRLYFASYRVWRSDNRGDSWTAISGDLTRNEERLALPIMGEVQSWDAGWDFNAMSNYNTITSLAESPLQEGLIYAGTDDGILQVTEDAGANWRKIEVGTMPGVPATAFINDVKADLHDANTVYVALDNHKYGDFQPYLVKSTDRGRTWTSITANLPERTLVWRIVQDHVKPELLFAATEFGVHFSIDGGGQWTQLKGGVPPIPFRDLTIQRRENDLVGASFGRSFFILDDYSPLREVSEEVLAQEAKLFKPRRAWWYQPRSIVGSQGSSKYAADNPPFGAVFTYHLGEGLTTLTKERQKREKELAKAGEELTFAGWDALKEEIRQPKPQILLTVKDANGRVVRRIDGPTRKGFHRVAWDLQHAPVSGIDPDRPNAGQGGFMAVPGEYSVTLSKMEDGQETVLAGPETFTVERLRSKGALDGASDQELIAYRDNLEQLWEDMSAASLVLGDALKRIGAMKTAAARSERDASGLMNRLYSLHNDLLDLQEQMNGSEVKSKIGERSDPTVWSRAFVAYRGLQTTYGPTAMHEQNLNIAKSELSELRSSLKTITEQTIPQLESDLSEAGAPWIQGSVMPDQNR